MQSQNGYPVLDSLGDCKYYSTGGISVPLAPVDAGWLLAYFLRRFDGAVEQLEQTNTHGYNKRKIANSDEWSNHASATAADANATKHPQGATGTFTPEQVTKIRKILDDFDGMVKWGGDYRVLKDEMHFEIVGTPEQVHLLTSIHKRYGKVYLSRLEPGNRNLDVVMVKRKLIKRGYDVGTYNNYYSVALTTALRKFQADNGLSTNGAADVRTLERLGLKPQ